jgi:hypothetical protein
VKDVGVAKIQTKKHIKGDQREERECRM